MKQEDMRTTRDQQRRTKKGIDNGQRIATLLVLPGFLNEQETGGLTENVSRYIREIIFATLGHSGYRVQHAVFQQGPRCRPVHQDGY
jgi:hypothetical protein